MYNFQAQYTTFLDFFLNLSKMYIDMKDFIIHTKKSQMEKHHIYQDFSKPCLKLPNHFYCHLSLPSPDFVSPFLSNFRKLSIKLSYLVPKISNCTQDLHFSDSYLNQGRICTVGTRARAHPIFRDLCSCEPPVTTPLLTVCPANIWYLATALQVIIRTTLNTKRKMVSNQ